MIRSLQIKNYAIIEALEINFADGLTIITGETGAGKSILLGALGLIMGKRADIKSLYNEDRKCVVEAFFDIKPYDLKSFFEQNDIDFEEELVVRREITPSGKSRAFVNDTPVNLKILQQLSGSLVDLHQQFDTLDIHNVSFQMRMIDALAGNKKRLRTYQDLFRQCQANKKILSDLVERSQRAGREIDFLNFQLEEFNEAELVDGEQSTLEAEQIRLTNAENIKRTLGAAFRFLVEEEQSVIGQLESIALSLDSVQKYDTKIGKLYERYNSLVIELQDIAGEFEQLGEETEYDEERIAEIQERLDIIFRLQNKHSVNTIEDLLQIQASIQEQLTAFSDLSADMESLEKEIVGQETQLKEWALVLRERRIAVIDEFEEKITRMLSQLGMEHAKMAVKFLPLEALNSMGLDEVNFLFAANKGGRLQLIKDVASGGELSRLTLVTKSLVASAIPLPTLIFDEIDSGISGDVALKMGNILRKLSNQHQVVTITHSPQVASKADLHYFVYKKDNDNRTIAKVRELNQEERIRAIATMLSQNPPSVSAIENAKELLSMV